MYSLYFFPSKEKGKRDPLKPEPMASLHQEDLLCLSASLGGADRREEGTGHCHIPKAQD